MVGSMSTMLTPARRWTIVGLLCVGFMIGYFDRVNLSVALTFKDFQTFFGMNDSDRGVLNAAFFWTYAAMQIPAGWLVDRYGAKRALLVGFAVWSLISASTGF